MTADFPAHFGWQNDVHLKRLEPNCRQPTITAPTPAPSGVRAAISTAA
jgi:hypothetical protein